MAAIGSAVANKILSDGSLNADHRFPTNYWDSDLLRRNSRAEELYAQVIRLLAHMRIAVIYGGNKSIEGSVIFPSHNPRSWKSYEAVAKDIKNSLTRLGCQNVVLIPDDMQLGNRLREYGVHFAWLNTGGVQGYCAVSHAAASLEMLGVPYIGHEPLSAGVLDSKHIFKRQLRGAGIATARFTTWHDSHGPFDPTTNNNFTSVFGDYRGPFVVKPVSGRASLHVEFIEDIEGLPAAVQSVFENTQNHVLIEEYLSGREYCVAIAGPVVVRHGGLSRLNRPFTFAHVERVLEKDERIFTSMDKRPITGARIRVLDPASEARVVSQLDDLANRTYEELDIETLIRLDVRADDQGRLHVLEANPKPDLKAPTADGVTSLIVEGLSQCDMNYDDLIMSLFADRIDKLFCHRRGSINHLFELLTACEA